MSRSYPYPKTSPIINLITALAMAGASVMLLSMAGDIGAEWMAVFALAVFGAVVVVYATPLFTDHLIAVGELRLRYGLVFRADILLSEITGVWALERGDSAKGALDLATEKSRRVLITLSNKRRFRHALWRSYDRIVFTAEDVPGMVSALGGERA
ncbi:MAG: hypothetical protein V1934_07955 [Methanobacteriota archaeon]